MSSELAASPNLAPSPLMLKSTRSASVAHGNGRRSDAGLDHAGASGDQAPIADIFLNIAKRLERVGDSFGNHSALYKSTHGALEAQAAADNAQLQQLEGLDMHVLNVRSTFKSESAELRRAFDKGFETLCAALDENIVVTKEVNQDLVRDIERCFESPTTAAKAVKQAKPVKPAATLK
ncbi:unnamed protein product [Peniophora sp. CBMAI 1063]|nr:unnamed protein product [Peniophora sp. CBMAI 1063]